MTEEMGSNSWQGQKIFLFSTSRSALRFILPPNQQTLGALPSEYSGCGTKTITQFHLVLKFRTCTSTIPLPHVFMACCLNKHRDNFSCNWVNRILTYLWLVPAGNTLTALMSNCNWSCVHGAEPFLLLPAAPEPPPQARLADSISSCRSRSMRRSVSSIACRKATRPSCANLVTSFSNLQQ